MMANWHSRPLLTVAHRSLLLLVLLFSSASPLFSQIWTEDFNAYPDATTDGSPKWTSYATDCDDGGNINLGAGISQWGVWAGAFTCNDIEGAPCCPTFGGGGNDNGWISEVINIDNYCNVSISLDYNSVGTFECALGGPFFICQNTVDDNAHDQILAQYRLDAGAWTQFGYLCGAGTGVFSVSGLNGNTLEIRVFFSNKSNGEFYYFDNVVVNGTTAPPSNFNPIGPLCELDAPVILPTTSTNGISGTWSPTTINPAGQGGNTITATFTPNVGQCGLPATIDVDITEPVVPMLTPIGPFCLNDFGLLLSPLNSGINGTWSGPGLTANYFTPANAGVGNFTLTFTPNPGQCATIATLPVQVEPNFTPVLSTATLCQSDPIFDLSDIVDPMYNFGVWDGPGVNAFGDSFDPSGQNGIVTLTYQAADACALEASTTITVNVAVTPPISGIPASICEADPPINLPTTQGGVPGNWSGQGVGGNMFDPSGLNGNITLTFTPNTGQCAAPNTTTINVIPETLPPISGLPASICESASPINLPTTLGGITGNWSGQGVSGNTFDPDGLSGNITLTFTPNTGQCAAPNTAIINVTTLITPPISGVPATICESDPPVNLPTTQGGITGNWSGQGVSGNTFDPDGLNGNITLTFTPNTGQCAAPNTAIVNVTPVTTPPISGVPATICESDPPINLPTTLGGITGNWSGQGVSGNTFDPDGLSGNITLTFTPNTGQCAAPNTAVINVTPLTIPPITGIPASLCENDPPINLPTTLGSITGTWSGQGVSGNSFDPDGLNGNITLTFSPNTGQCAAPNTTIINVTPATTPAISGIPATICETDAPINLPTTLSGVTGNWSGQGVLNNVFDPSGLNGNITLTFTPNTGFCANLATTSIVVNIPGTPVLDVATLCETDGLFPLSTLNDPNYPAGTWSGPGVSGGNFNPNGQNGNVTLTFSPSAACVNQATTIITVNLPNVPSLNTAMLCENDQPFPLVTIADPNFPTGTWSGPGVNSGNFDPTGQNGNVTLTFTPSANCTVVNTTTVTVNLGPSFTAITEDCGPTNTDYTVSFTIFNGSVPYSVDGVNVPGNTFTSAPIPSGQPYSFEIDDANGCGPVTVSGVENCNCATNAGTINLSGGTQTLCYEFTQFSVPFNQDEFLDPNDALIFVLHDNPGATLGNIFATSTSPVFPTPPGLTLGQTYYVSAVAGNDDGIGGVDLSDPCLSVSQGLPIVFYLPTVSLGNDATICATDCYDIPLLFTGIAPFMVDLEISLNGNFLTTISADNLAASSTIEFCPADFNITNGVIELSVAALSDNNLCNVDLSNDPAQPSITITVGAAAVNDLAETLCPGEQIVVNGTVYNAANPSGTELIPNGSNSGCDSLINVDLMFYPPAIFNLTQTYCAGETVTINGMVYDQSNPTGTEVLQNASFHGCDSTIMVNLTFLAEPSFNLTQTLCSGGSLTVNGTVYNEANPTGTEIILNGAENGCDSTVVVSLSFSSIVNSNIAATLCPGGSIVVNGTIYDQSNPSGTETMPGMSFLGCDSVANVSLSFYPPAIGNYVQTLCTGGSITIGSTVFDESNPSGTVVLPNASFHQCDSTVVVNLSFSNVVTSTINPTLCPGESVVVNGTTYDQANPTGVENMTGGSFLGCDSVANVNLSFYPAAIGNFTQTLCQGESVNIGGTLFNQANPNGQVILPNASFHNCDSTVNVGLQFYPVAIGSFAQTLCQGGSVTIGGTLFNQANPNGQVVLPDASFHGCDSTVNVSLQFYPVAIGNFTQTFCQGESVTIGGTVFNQNNPNGQVVLQNASFHNCDSTVNVSLFFAPPATSNVVETLCSGETLTVGNQTFGQTNPTGTVILPNASYLDCDSIVNVSLSFYPPATSTIDDQLCIGGSITVNGTDYNEQNPSGTEVIPNGSVNGCDSTIFIDLSFGSSVIVNIDPMLCPDETLVINGTTYSADNPTGSITFPGGSYLGCDSTININLGFYQDAVGNITLLLQQGGSITVNGTVYDEQNPSGMEVFQGASFYGCDSTVIINLTFEGAPALAVTQVNQPLCHFGVDGSIIIDTILGGAPPYVVALNGSNSSPVVSFPVVFSDLSFGFYTITIVDALGVVSSQEIFMPDAPALTVDFGFTPVVPLGNSITLTPTASAPVTTWAWSPPNYLSCTDCQSPICTPLNDITYSLIITDQNGCTAEGELKVVVDKVEKVYVPNAFSPNNDGINDELTVFAGPQVAEINSLMVFTRWGESVFERFSFKPNDLQLGWDGTHKGNPLDPAVFVWYAEVKFLDGTIRLFKGDVTLVR